MPGLNRDNERGQVVVLAAVMMIVLLGLAGFAMDVAKGYVAKRQAQTAADAAAFAAASALQTGSTAAAAQTAANNLSNGGTGGGGSITTSVTVSGANITVTSTRTVNTNFVRVIPGAPTQFAPSVTVKALGQTFTQWSGHVMPFYVLPTNAGLTSPGTSVCITGGSCNAGSTPGNDGFLTLRDGSSCGLDQGAAALGSFVSGATAPCAIPTNDTSGPLEVETKPGNNMGPVSAALDTRFASLSSPPWAASDMIVGSGATSHVINPEDPRVLVIPIGTPTGGGKKPVNVQGFAQFVVTNYDGNTVTGVFTGRFYVKDTDCNVNGATSTCTTGTFDNTNSQLPTVVKVLPG